ncbi:hypothetical protein HOLleu_30584 [Holothuria leucospilota]|uniref:Uncharacterized protein n=1 Tax=Holothuria leucospilota TaxID=206669 RepID=A0A9Q1BKP1_HOLLE|nr:hypothetical protein HOLleu_30584 [Holothuria leucospilota]
MPYWQFNAFFICFYSPNWKCDCKLYYNCDTTNTGFPDEDLGASPSGVVKDLAPGDYPMQIAGKQWRRSVSNRRRYCERECYRRMNAFLCLDGNGDETAYSRAAVCTKLQQAGIVATDATANAPCCEVFLRWGLQWCDNKWNKSIFSVFCKGETTGFPADTVIVTPTSCAVGATDSASTWCSATAPACVDEEA